MESFTMFFLEKLDQHLHEIANLPCQIEALPPKVLNCFIHFIFNWHSEIANCHFPGLVSAEIAILWEISKPS